VATERLWLDTTDLYTSTSCGCISYFILKSSALDDKKLWFLFKGVPVLDFYMVEIFEASSLTFSPALSAIIVRAAEILSNYKVQSQTIQEQSESFITNNSAFFIRYNRVN
jgi:hypothetical protein